MMFVRSVVVVLGIQAAATTQAVWTQLGIQSTTPSGRHWHAMTSDSARQRVVLFGGQGAQGSPSTQTWEWDGTNWSEHTPGSSPPGRWAHALAFDSARQRTVLFGGQHASASSYPLADTWEWDGMNWLQRTPAAGPSRRARHAMVYDSARQRLVLFGGEDANFFGAPFGDTWEWDGTNWSLQSPATSPPGRSRHAMAYDPVRHRTVLFGGLGGSFTTVLADTWEWNGSYWVAVFTPTFPAARFDHAVAYDAARQRTVLFGGGTLSVQGMDDTWEFNGTNWTYLPPTGTWPYGPASRSGHAMAYDAARARVVLACGANGSAFSDTWINGPVPVVASATSYGAGCGQPALGFVPDSSGRPVIGQTGTASITNVPTSIAFVAMGSSRQTYGPFTLPVTLAGIGMIGCDLHQSAEVLGLGTGPLGPSTRSFTLAIPNTLTLLGLHVYMQAYAFAPGANPLNVIISNAIDWRLGDI